MPSNDRTKPGGAQKNQQDQEPPEDVQNPFHGYVVPQPGAVNQDVSSAPSPLPIGGTTLPPQSGGLSGCAQRTYHSIGVRFARAGPAGEVGRP